MKTRLPFFALATLLCITSMLHAQTATSIANGNWTSPMTWGGTPPLPGATVIINHAVTMDIDYGYNSGSITINTSGSLIGNSSMRAFAVSGGTLTVNGTFNIPRVALFSGAISNSGTIISDSLFNQATFQNMGGGAINAPQFMIGTGGKFTNNGTVTATNFLNVDTVTNNGTINSNDFMNTKRFINSASGVISLGFDFLNADSLSTTAIFTNNGSINVGHDWENRSQINGSGKFCVAIDTYNSGAITGTLDFCDQTGGSFDLNTGTVAGTVTYCQFSCSAGQPEISKTETINTFPNPNDGLFLITSNTNFSSIEIIDFLGRTIQTIIPEGVQTEINLQNQPNGIYFCKIRNKQHEVISIAKIIID